MHALRYVASGSDTTSDMSNEATLTVVKLITSVREKAADQSSPNKHQTGLGATSNTVTSTCIILSLGYNIWIAAMHGRCSGSNDDEDGLRLIMDPLVMVSYSTTTDRDRDT